MSGEKEPEGFRCVYVCVCMCVCVDLCVCLYTCAPWAPRVGEQPSSPPFTSQRPRLSHCSLICVSPSGQGCKVTAVILGDPWVSTCEYLDCTCSPSLAGRMRRWPCREAHGGWAAGAGHQMLAGGGGAAGWAAGDLHGCY